MRKLSLVLLMAFCWLTIVHAQEATEVPIDVSTIDTDVYITTQFDINLREGPSVHWPILAGLEAGTTLPAIGRTSASNWVQVVQDGRLGWLAVRYLVWTGDIIALPVDGRFFDEYVRRVGVLAITTQETPYYRDWVDPSTYVASFPEGTEVEVVGRLGYRDNLDFNVMVLYEDQFYWLWAAYLNLEAGRYRQVLDNSYRNAYTRLVNSFNSDISEGLNRLSAIEDIWRRLQRGEGVSCGYVPSQLGERTISDGDLSGLPQFGSVASALDTGIEHTNSAIAMFEDACNRSDAYITQENVRLALDEVDSARQNFNVSRSLLISLQRRDPLIGDIETP
jgi:uncharacterized protein YraI